MKNELGKVLDYSIQEDPISPFQFMNFRFPLSNGKRLLCLGQCDSVSFLIHQVSDGV